jgi:hypothetical protein
MSDNFLWTYPILMKFKLKHKYIKKMIFAKFELHWTLIERIVLEPVFSEMLKKEIETSNRDKFPFSLKQEYLNQ